MSSNNKAVVAIVLGVFALFSLGILNMLHLRLGVPVTLGGSFLCSIVAVYFGIQARKGGAKILGLVGLVLGIIGVVILGFNILTVVASRL